MILGKRYEDLSPELKFIYRFYGQIVDRLSELGTVGFRVDFKDIKFDGKTESFIAVFDEFNDALALQVDMQRGVVGFWGREFGLSDPDVVDRLCDAVLVTTSLRRREC